MSVQATIKRYSLILDYVSRIRYPSFREIKEMLYSEGFQISERTLQRDIEDIRDEFGLELTWDSSRNGYFIDYENSINADYILHFIELVVSSQILIESLKEGKKILNYIAFDSWEDFRGLNNLPKLLSAIKSNSVIKFSHTSYQSGRTSRQEVYPYLLKEHQGRWYLYAFNPSIEEFRIYGLDRITEIKVTDRTYKPKKNLDLTQRFRDMIGISSAMDGQEKQKIVLSFTKDQWKYFEALPWFKPYEILADKKNHIRISLEIIPNTELLQTILKHSDSVTVIEPAWLRLEIRDILEEALKRY